MSQCLTGTVLSSVPPMLPLDPVLWQSLQLQAILVQIVLLSLTHYATHHDLAAFDKSPSTSFCEIAYTVLYALETMSGLPSKSHTNRFDAHVQHALEPCRQNSVLCHAKLPPCPNQDACDCSHIKHVVALLL